MFIGMNLAEVKEPKAVANGRYELVISTAEYKDAKSPEKAPMIQVGIAIDGHVDAPQINHFISLPKAGEDPKKSQFKMLMAKRFLHQFGIPYDETQGFNVEDFPGARANCQVVLDEPNERNQIFNRLELDRLPNE